MALRVTVLVHEAGPTIGALPPLEVASHRGAFGWVAASCAKRRVKCKLRTCWQAVHCAAVQPCIIS